MSNEKITVLPVVRVERLDVPASRYEALMNEIQWHTTVSCTGLQITIDVTNHDAKDKIMNLLCGDDVS